MKLLKQIATIGFLALTQMSCAPTKNAGVNLGVSITPEKAYIVPGKGVSCVAQAAAKADDSVPIADIEGDHVLFNRFALQWRGGDALTIAQIKATIFSSSITGAETTDGLEVTMDEAEMAALLGLSSLSLPITNPYDKDAVRNIDSTDATSKTSSSPYAPCGFQIGGITAVKGVKSYTARIKVEVLGYSTALDGSQLPVRQSVTLTAQAF